MCTGQVDLRYERAGGVHKASVSIGINLDNAVSDGASAADRGGAGRQPCTRGSTSKGTINLAWLDWPAPERANHRFRRE
ncbi:MAG: hypothetical protein MJE77_40475 [Proteobacteria bacterium]|nr:hypothetical protein [Pseudomonadota bacterium]